MVDDTYSHERTVLFRKHKDPLQSGRGERAPFPVEKEEEGDSQQWVNFTKTTLLSSTLFLQLFQIKFLFFSCVQDTWRLSRVPLLTCCLTRPVPLHCRPQFFGLFKFLQRSWPWASLEIFQFTTYFTTLILSHQR